ncbi:hypothetical protein LZ31DRAFT_237719 [Colletotrichum somersetense]|nr:hypothetical protein LZ31DRAFT_237719 [Colletotrichum somersetense]
MGCKINLDPKLDFRVGVPNEHYRVLRACTVGGCHRTDDTDTRPLSLDDECLADAASYRSRQRPSVISQNSFELSVNLPLSHGLSRPRPKATPMQQHGEKRGPLKRQQPVMLDGHGAWSRPDPSLMRPPCLSNYLPRPPYTPLRLMPPKLSRTLCPSSPLRCYQFDSFIHHGVGKRKRGFQNPLHSFFCARGSQTRIISRCPAAITSRLCPTIAQSSSSPIPNEGSQVNPGI